MLKNTRVKSSLTKVLPFFGGVVLTTAAILGGSLVTYSSSDSVSDSLITLSPKPVNAASDVAAMEKSVHRQINQYRKKQGLKPLKLNSKISKIARQHSKKMADKQVAFGHNGVSSRYNKISKVVEYRGVAENVAYNMGYDNPGKNAVKGWIKSSGHRRNIKGKYQVTGIGVAKNSEGEYYFTQLFVNPQ
ncbi:Cysteine-rich secretory protein family [Rivularia sp. PCC 7116]|uniref:CAP domain-containing protein n=1 Tax=Rivularia sp. PCC 7116 TaxID=373994 RepID=UPI00029EFDC4|nr:CAP domain-containing protein [Rivularia sp. PCC 7116]AFY56172.1 Cysteine-rich secretory protein family [Rivularia sp. PCC 7116]